MDNKSVENNGCSSQTKQEKNPYSIDAEDANEEKFSYVDTKDTSLLRSRNNLYVEWRKDNTGKGKVCELGDVVTVDWNSIYHSIINSDLTKEKRKIQEDNFATEFFNFSKKIAKVIISEINNNVKNESKQVKPIVAGIMGGEKYICGGVFFKIAFKHVSFIDSYHYSKFLNIEKKNMDDFTEFSKTDPESFNVSPSVFFTYLGYSVLASSILPINKDTLLTGSNDGFYTFSFCKDINPIIEKIGKNWHLSKHVLTYCESSVDTAFDIEYHKGTDGRFYALDMTRLSLTKTNSDEKIQWTNQFRMDFLNTYCKDLCACTDTFIKPFKNHSSDLDSMLSIYDEQLNKMVKNLESFDDYNQVIPSDYIHSFGVNLNSIIDLNRNTVKKDSKTWNLIQFTSAVKTMKRLWYISCIGLQDEEELNDFAIFFLKKLFDFSNTNYFLLNLKWLTDTLSADVNHILYEINPDTFFKVFNKEKFFAACLTEIGILIDIPISDFITNISCSHFTIKQKYIPVKFPNLINIERLDKIKFETQNKDKVFKTVKK